MATPVPWVPADAPRLERVLVNLLTNALKHSAPETPVVVRLEQEGPQVRIQVRDQGEGLHPEELARLFTKYYRTGEGQRAEGVGLGLYISQLIIKAHGGQILVESTPGQGSTFTVTLPLTEPALKVESQATPLRGRERPPPVFLRRHPASCSLLRRPGRASLRGLEASRATHSSRHA
jgi:K+-sensing histidine kinase KdpD